MADIKKYSFSKGLIKTGINLLIIGLPIVLQVMPNQLLDLTLGGAISLLVNYLKVKHL